MTTTAWFHCFNGVAGDMTLGALLDAGADLGDVRAAIERLNISDWALDVERTQRCGITAARAIVTAPDLVHHRRFAEVRGIVVAADLGRRLTDRALAAFSVLADVEGAIHGTPPDDVEFHEVGSLDAIVDIVGSCAALESLGVEQVGCSPITVGAGTFTAAHGVLPNPGPAVLGLLARAGAPHRSAPVDLELATPTGVALMTTLAGHIDGRGFGPMPDGVVRSIGYGAGGRDLVGRPNVVQVVVIDAAVQASGHAAGRASGVTAGQPVRLLEANVDDATGEVLAHTVSALLAAGAYDAWVTPIVMKKGRPAHTVHALCDPAVADAVAATLVAESGTFGLRGTTIERWPQARNQDTVEVEGYSVRRKIGAVRVKAEFDDAAEVARVTGLPLREVLRRAEGAEPSTLG